MIVTVDAFCDTAVWVTVNVVAFCDTQLVAEVGGTRLEHVTSEIVTVLGGGQYG